MSGRFSYSVLLSAFILSAVSPCALFAQEAVQIQPTVANSRFEFAGTVNSPDVLVRSGPGEAYYATTRLPAGTPVTVVGITYQWLKISPPPGSFCYVSKMFVDASPEGTTGRVSRSDVNVRAGSDQTALKTTVVGKLNEGDTVSILGSQDEYFRIAPPSGTYLYVDKQYVNPVRSLGIAPPDSDNNNSNVSVAANEGAQTTSSDTTTTQPSLVAGTTTPPPATQPVVPTPPPGPSPSELAETQFNAVEVDFSAASLKPLEDQPCADLAKRYAALSTNMDLAQPDRVTAGFRLAILKIRLDAQAKLADVAAMQTAAAGKAQGAASGTDRASAALGRDGCLDVFRRRTIATVQSPVRSADALSPGRSSDGAYRDLRQG